MSLDLWCETSFHLIFSLSKAEIFRHTEFVMIIMKNDWNFLWFNEIDCVSLCICILNRCETIAENISESRTKQRTRASSIISLTYCANAWFRMPLIRWESTACFFFLFFVLAFFVWLSWECVKAIETLHFCPFCYCIAIRLPYVDMIQFQVSALWSFSLHAFFYNMFCYESYLHCTSYTHSTQHPTNIVR